MNMTVEQARGDVPVTILTLHGDLDGSNYDQVIDHARTLYQAGTRRLLIDLGDVPFLSSAGLVALHRIALLLAGRAAPNAEDGWQALHDLEQDQEGGVQPHVKLLNPRPKILRTLELTGLNAFFDVYTDRQAAIAAFS